MLYIPICFLGGVYVSSGIICIFNNPYFVNVESKTQPQQAVGMFRLILGFWCKKWVWRVYKWCVCPTAHYWLGL